MFLGKRFERFVEGSAVSVMVRGTLERVFNPEKLDGVFEDNAVVQYTKELTFSQCVYMMSDVVTRVEPSVGAWYKSHSDETAVTRQAVYDKLKHMELPISAALVSYSGSELLECLRRMKAQPSTTSPRLSRSGAGRESLGGNRASHYGTASPLRGSSPWTGVGALTIPSSIW